MVGYIIYIIYIVGTLGLRRAGGAALDAGSHRWVSRARVAQVRFYPGIVYVYIYPLCGETLEPLSRFVRKLPKDSNLAEDGFPGLTN